MRLQLYDLVMSSTKHLPPPALRVGDRICYQMKGDPQIGFIRWIGVLPAEVLTRGGGGGSSSSSFSSSTASSSFTSAAQLLYAGVEFLNPVGNGNGAVKVKRSTNGKMEDHTIQYFQCRKNHAGFVKLSSLTKLRDQDSSRRHNDSVGSQGSSVSSSNRASVSSIGSSFSRMSFSASFDDDDEEEDELPTTAAKPKIASGVNRYPGRRAFPGSNDSDSSSGATVEASKKKSCPVLAISKCVSEAVKPPSPLHLTSPMSPTSGSRSSSSVASNYKSALCSYWQETGICPIKHNCNFAHGIEEKRLWDAKLRKGRSIAGYDNDNNCDTRGTSAFVAPRSPSNVPSNYKSAICTYWQQNGSCPGEDDCNFAHGNEEKRFWDAQLRKGRGVVPRGIAGYDGNDEDDSINGDPRATRVKTTYRSDGQFSSKAFAKDKADVRKGGRILTSMSK